MSTASGDIVRKRRTGARRPLTPLTWLIIAIVVVVSFGAMFLALSGLWPFSGEGSTVGLVTPTSQYAKGIKVEPIGEPVRDGDQVTLKVKITNNVLQLPAAHGTPTPDAPTPMPEPAKVLNATVKVLYYFTPPNGTRSIVGSGVGNYFSPQGLANGQTAQLDVVSIGVGNFNSYEVFPDTVWTDKDPVKTPEPGGSRRAPVLFADYTP